MDRVIYKKMLERDIDTLTLHRALEKIGIDINKRTLQRYVDSDFEKGPKEIKLVAEKMISSYDKMIEELQITLIINQP